MSALRIGTVRLRPHYPTVVVPITDRTAPRSIVLATGIGVDFVEARVDLFRKHAAESAGPFIK